MAKIATGNPDDALELVQDAMLKLAQRYPERSELEWGPLFHRILQNRIQDWYRRSTLRNRWFGWLFSDDDDDPIQQAPDPYPAEPLNTLSGEETMGQIEQALASLPLRQQQAFLLRCWEGLSVAETAKAMACSDGSVKTHYSRALSALRRQLEEVIA